MCVSQPRDRESPGRLPNGVEALPERTPRPDRPRARDRPKPRRRPRPKEPGQGGPGEARRSRSAPAQSSAPPPPPPTHTVQHEGFLFRKHELDGPNKKASNRLVGLGVEGGGLNSLGVQQWRGSISARGPPMGRCHDHLGAHLWGGSAVIWGLLMVEKLQDLGGHRWRSSVIWVPINGGGAS